jgi:tetratricopeptide (TPR) repeat protein
MFDQKNQIKIGEAYLKRNNPDKALYFYERAKRLEPKDSYSYLLIANIDETQEKWDEAVTNYLEAISLVPLDLSQYHLKVYKIYLIKMQKEVANKDLDKAMLYFKLTLDGFPSYQKKVDGMKLYNQTVKLIKQNKKEEVVSVLKKYIKEGQKLKGNLGVTREEILRTVDLLRNNLIN